MRWLNQNWFKIFLALFSLSVFLYFIGERVTKTENLAKETVDNNLSANTITRAYIKAQIANIRSCPATTCEKIGQFYQNAWIDFPASDGYTSVADFPEWVQINSIDGKPVIGYINRINFSNTPTINTPSLDKEIKTQIPLITPPQNLELEFKCNNLGVAYEKDDNKSIEDAGGPAIVIALPAEYGFSSTRNTCYYIRTYFFSDPPITSMVIKNLLTGGNIFSVLIRGDENEASKEQKEKGFLMTKYYVTGE